MSLWRVRPHPDRILQCDPNSPRKRGEVQSDRGEQCDVTGKTKGATARGRSAFHIRRVANDQFVCWIAESSQLAPRGRRKVHTSVASDGCSLPSTSRPVVRSTVLSTIENRIATLAKSVSPSRQASARSPCNSLVSETLLTTLRARLASRSPV